MSTTTEFRQFRTLIATLGDSYRGPRNNATLGEINSVVVATPDEDAHGRGVSVSFRDAKCVQMYAGDLSPSAARSLAESLLEAADVADAVLAERLAEQAA